MPKPMDVAGDDRTVILSRLEQASPEEPLTDFSAPPSFEQLSERLFYAERPFNLLPITTNPIVAAASPLLSECVRLKNCPQVTDITALNTGLSAAITQFQHRALQAGVDSREVMAARYLLCAMLDETIGSTSWGEQHWGQMSLLSAFHNETFGGVKFFQLLAGLKCNPVKHQSMLELIYLCLSLGFEGRYRREAGGPQTLKLIRDELFRQLRPLQADGSREVSPHWQGLTEPAQPRVRMFSWRVVALCTLIALGAMYGGLAWVLSEQRDTLMQLHQQITSTPSQP
ncbi:type IVB secretion system protein IcmH/DotU [Pseudomonas sp. NPDC098747]|uniref:type IVB secretion system protein IcmH/DotU n=1 Tax=Pseudomonas sp. NPDC098747 TaxID=3364487 RepID=UPI00383AD49C